MKRLFYTLFVSCAACAFAEVDTDALPDVEDGFEINFFVKEPHIINPSSLCFDKLGRLYVGAGPQYRHPKEDSPADYIKILIDEDGDGVAETVKTFAEGFNCVEAMAWKGDELWVANAPELTVLRDTDGDDVADEYQVIYTGLNNLRHGLHGLNWGPDGWLYFSMGNTWVKPNAPKPIRDLMGITSDDKTEYPLTQVYTKDSYPKTYHPMNKSEKEGGIFRCRPGGHDLELWARGMRNPWDICMDSGFNWLGTDNDPGPPGDRIFMPIRHGHYSMRHPWKFDWMGRHPAVAPSSDLFPGVSGSGTGVVFYTAEHFPAKYRNRYLIADWTNNCIFLYEPKWQGALQVPAVTKRKIVDGGVTQAGDLGYKGAKGRSLFRPTDIEVGPDGALYMGGWGSVYGTKYVPKEKWTPEENAKYQGRVFRLRHQDPLIPRSTWNTAKRKHDIASWTFAQLIEDIGSTRADMDGLIHLPLGQEAWRVQDVVLRLEDFELSMEDGSLFATPESLGRTALVFLGRGKVHFSPRPLAEREQLRQFAGKEELDKTVDWAFVRLHPADFEELIDTSRLQPDPSAERRRPEAAKRWAEWAPRSFLVDAALPRSPWWLHPGPGDALVEFPWKRGRVLTLALANGEEENVNLFERDRGLRICSYRSHDRPARSGGDRRGVDVLHHDVIARFDPSQFLVSATDTLRLRVLSPMPTLRLKLHDDFRVCSVTTEDGRGLLFLRVRERGSLVVSLGPYARRVGELSLTVRYSGRHDPGPVDGELLQLFADRPSQVAEQMLLTPSPIVYSNRTAWYPRPSEEDFATLRARFHTPEGVLAVTGGELVSVHESEGWVRSEYRPQKPGRYFTAIVGRLEDVGLRQLGRQAVRGFAAPRTEGLTRRNLAIAQELLAFYAERFGPCPYPVINQAVAHSATPGGHSPPGMVYLQERPAMLMRALPEDPANFSDMPDFFLAHELAHQWWGQGVAPASYRDQWLSEAWAQYASALWVRHKKGEEAFLEMLERMASWARRHDDMGPVHLGQRLGHLKRDRLTRRALVYDKGALVLHMLRQIVGDEAFFGSARSFLERHRYTTATTEDLRAALEEAGGRDLEAHFEHWIYGTGVPTLEWASRSQQTPDGFETTVQVRPEGLPAPLPLEIAVTTSRNREVRRVVLEPGGGSWTIATPDPVRGVRINENLGILAEEKEVRRLKRPPQR